MKKPFYALVTLCLLSALFFIGCNKKEKVEVDNETQSAVDNAVADQEYMAVAPAVQSHAINTKGVGATSRTLALCDSLTKVGGDTLWGTMGHVDPTYTMSVSNADCNRTMADGRFRTGYISIRITGKIRETGSQMIIKMMNYHAATISYTCDSMVVTTIASNTLFTSFNVKLINGVCSKLNTWTIHYSLDRTITFYQNGNPAGTDRVTSIYGVSSGINRQGRAFSVVIPQASPLVKYNSCEFISSGVLQLTPNGFATRTIDYGYSIAPDPVGGCDENASFTVNGSTVAFKLK